MKVTIKTPAMEVNTELSAFTYNDTFRMLIELIEAISKANKEIKK